MRALVLAALLGAPAALAYVLPQESILRRMVEARDGLQLSTLRVEGSLTFEGDALGAATGPLALPEGRSAAQADATFSMKLPGRCRVEAHGAQPERQVVAINSSGRRKSAGNGLAMMDRALGELCHMLALRSSSESQALSALQQHLRQLGVSTRHTRLARFGARVAYVLGAPEEGAAQLWVYKDSFMPARVMWSDEDGTRWDVWMLDYTSPATGEHFPRIWEVHRNGERQLRFNALASDVRAKLADSLFAVQ